jgi:hypothetical protein
LDQIAAIPFAQGLDTKSDPKALSFGPLLELENGVFAKTGAINRRSGYVRLGKYIEAGAGTSVDACVGLASFNSELLCFNGTKVFSRLASTDHWSDRGAAVLVRTEDTQVIRNSYQQSNPDLAVAYGMRCTVWEDSRGGVRYSLQDVETGAIIVSDTDVHASATKPKVLAFADEFAIFYVVSGDIFLRRIGRTTPTTLATASSVVSSMHTTSNQYDVHVVGERLFIAFNDTSNQPTLTYLTNAYATAGATVSIATSSGGGASDSRTCITLFTQDPEALTVGLAWYGSTVQRVEYATRNYDMTDASFAFVVESGIANVVRITAVMPSGGGILGASVRVFYEVSAASAADTHVRLSGAVFMRSVGLAGKAFVYGSYDYWDGGTRYTVDRSVNVPLVHSSTLQATYFLAEADALSGAPVGSIAARINPTIAGGLRTTSVMAESCLADTGEFEFANQIKGKFVSVAGTSYSQLGINATRLLLEPGRIDAAHIDRNLIVAGGVLQGYDGVRATEHGFHVFPEGVTWSAAVGGGGLTVAESYQRCVVYEWTDANGAVHRSAPSPVAVQSGGSATAYVSAAGNETVTITVPTLRLTAKSDVRIVLYRTIGNEDVFYRVSSAAATANNKTTDTVTITDTTSDATLASNELLYTTGGWLEAIAPPACSLITTYRGRVFLAGSSNPCRIHYSSATIPTEAVVFNDSLTIDVDTADGPITAIASLDQYLVIFKRNSIFVTQGDGPTQSGDQNDLDAGVTRVSSDVGCRDPGSVVLTPQGLMFRSPKGIYALSRGLEVQYIGAPVEGLLDDDVTIMAAEVVADRSEVRFIVDGVAANSPVYNYLMGQWSSFTNHDGVGACVWNDTFCFAKSDGRVLREDRDTWTDGGEAYSLKLVTSWLQTSGLLGFQRVKRAWIIGTYKGAHRLLVQFGYDFSPAWRDELEIDAEALLNPAAYGATSEYGDDSYYGGPFPDYRWGVHLKTQKCQAIRMALTDVQTEDFNEGLSLSGVAMAVMQKRGNPKLAATRGSLGSSGA